jgi:hypothetical protein
MFYISFRFTFVFVVVFKKVLQEGNYDPELLTRNNCLSVLSIFSNIKFEHSLKQLFEEMPWSLKL